MSGLFGAGKVQKSAPDVSSLRVTTSCYGRPYPIGWGKFKVAGFLLWYGDFKAIPHEQATGGKGGSTPANVNYTYETAAVIGICEGTINAIDRLWKGKDVLVGTGTSTQTYQKREQVWVPASGVVTVDAPAAITAVVAVSIDWFSNSDIRGRVLALTTDYTRSGNTFTFLTLLGVETRVVIEYQYSRTASPVSPLGQANLTLFSGAYGQGIWSYLTTNRPAEAVPYSGIAYAAASTYELGTSSDFPNTSFEVTTSHGYSTTISDVNPKDFVLDYLTNPYYGAFFPSEMLGDLAQYSDYCVASGLFLSPDYTEQTPAAEVMTRLAAITNSDWTFYDERFNLIPYADQAVTGNGKTFTPNLVAEYELGPDDFMDRGDSGPITIKRKDPNERYNTLKVKYRNRAAEYNDDIVDGKDEAEIGKNGLRPAPYDTDVPEVKTRIVAQAVANLLVQRSVNVCNVYKFQLKANKCGIVCMCLLALTHPDYSLSQQLVRVIEIDEDEDGALMIEAEEVPVGTASSINYPLQTLLGYTVNYNAAPGNVSAPVFFELPERVTGKRLCVGVAVTGVGADWGGCEIWVSIGGTTYKQLGEIRGGSRYGSLNSSMGATTAQVTLLAGQLLSGSATDANVNNTLCYIGGAVPEYISYQTATLVTGLTYNLASVVRGALSSGFVSNHTGGDPFVRIDDRIAESDELDIGLIGQTLSFKFLSFNEFGGGKQDLADVSAYTYTVTGKYFKADDVLNWDFQFGVEGWTNVPSTTTGSDASAGVYGVALNQAGITESAGRRIPIDITKKYRVRARVRRPAGGTGAGGLYVGVKCLDSAGALIPNTGGTDYAPWCAAVNVLVPNDGQWYVYEAVMSGTNALPYTGSNYSKFWAGTVFAQPTVLQAAGFNGALHIDYAEIIDVTEQVLSTLLQFTANISWDFNKTLDGWTAGNATLSLPNESTLLVTATAADPLLYTPSNLNIQGRLYDKVRMRVRRANSTSSVWDGTLYYTTAGHGNSVSFYKRLPSSSAPGSAWSILEWDMADLTVGGTDWVTSAITQLRFDLDGGGTGNYEIDWVSVGRLQPSGDLSLVANSQWVVNDKMLQVGDTFSKQAGTAAWEGQVYSLESYVGGAYLSFIPKQNNAEMMVGLNTDPTTDASYTSLDYAIYCTNTGTLAVYSNNVAIYTGGLAYAAGDVLSITYDGQFVRFLKNGSQFYQVPAAANLRLYADSSFLVNGSAIAKFTFGPLTSNFYSRSGNLMDCSWWAASRTAINPGWGGNQSGAGAADGFGVSYMPDGSQQIAWYMTQGAGAINGGGWNPGPAQQPGNWFPIDPNKPYLFAVYCRRQSGDSSYWWGVNGNDVCALNGTTQNANPYFVGGFVPPASGRWYLLIGWVLPYNTTGNLSLQAGAWDTVLGTKVADGLCFNWASPAQIIANAGGSNPPGHTGTRAYQFYGAAGSQGLFAQPQVFLCDGSEPSLQDLLTSARPGTTDAFNSGGINGNFNQWPAEAVFPVGWGDWSNGGTRIKELATVRSGPYAIRWQPDGTAGFGMVCSYNFGTAPRALGEYLEGEVEMYVVSSANSGFPGLLVRIYTNAANSTFVDTVVPITSKALGVWQRVPFVAVVGVGQQIYGWSVFVMAAWSGIPPGVNFQGDVIYDNLTMRYVKQAGTLQLGNEAATQSYETFVNSFSGSSSGIIANVSVVPNADWFAQVTCYFNVTAASPSAGSLRVQLRRASGLSVRAGFSISVANSFGTSDEPRRVTLTGNWAAANAGTENFQLYFETDSGGSISVTSVTLTVILIKK